MKNAEIKIDLFIKGINLSFAPTLYQELVSTSRMHIPDLQFKKRTIHEKTTTNTHDHQ
jgi:hypothetical protein